ncbi:MAG: hypothetical protein AW09_001226 [Candidatus Accumulibacter phosphatis]|uniref:Uncharacterized protein n=1 Tax=Candidatus Accumulibacter phosphatis TaxID=327160 RepID=A0A080LXL7_9PROT|nr:MAG: hypothetical protein AW09_001226 [Candidatus Accumulibacter phosphatis]
MGGVVPRKELLAVDAGIFDTTEALGEFGTVLQGLELGLGVGMVVREIGPAVALGDAEILPQGGDGLAAHTGPAVRVESECAGRDVLFGGSVGDQLLCQFGGFPGGDHPANDIATENIEDHVEVKAGALGRPLQLGDVPAPHLVGRGGQEFWLGVGGMGELVASLAARPVAGQQTVHGTDRSEIDPLVQQGGIDGGGCAIGKALAHQDPP